MSMTAARASTTRDTQLVLRVTLQSMERQQGLEERVLISKTAARITSPTDTSMVTTHPPMTITPSTEATMLATEKAAA